MFLFPSLRLAGHTRRNEFHVPGFAPCRLRLLVSTGVARAPPSFPRHLQRPLLEAALNYVRNKQSRSLTALERGSLRILRFEASRQSHGVIKSSSWCFGRYSSVACAALLPVSLYSSAGSHVDCVRLKGS